MKPLLLFLKGVAMGAANVIPGVSGGTVAFITGIFERLIAAIKAIDLAALRLFFTGKWKSFAEKIDLAFLFWIFLGVGVSIFSLAKGLEWALLNQEILTLALFFGLILASILGIGKEIKKYDTITTLSATIGCLIAIVIAFLPPAQPNAAIWYVFLCGIVAVCSMILPGLSGSYILLLMGNYALVLSAIYRLDFGILIPLLLGAVVGLVFFSRLLSWLFQKNQNATVSLLTGFVTGSLLIIWPWKKEIFALFEGKEKVVGYDWYFPSIDGHFFMALGLCLIGFLLVWWLGRFSPAK